MDVYRYIARIGYRREVRPTLQTLRGLQESHLLSVPFENLDIHAGRRIVLESTALFEKIILRKRGGFCYELNGLFHELLRDLGFHVKLAMGRVYDRDRRTYGPEFDHLLILAEVGREEWLVDVGFGDFSLHPLRVMLDAPLTDSNGQFLIERHSEEYFKVSRYQPAARQFIPEYLFSPVGRALTDFSHMCLYHQISPDSHFTRQRVCSIATPAGRVTLTDSKLILTEHGVRQERLIRNSEDFRNVLARYFDIVMD